MAKRRGLRYTEFNVLTSEFILKNLPFILFLGFLAMIYIASGHYAERNVRQIQVLQKELKELRWQYMSLQSDIMFNSQRSRVAGQVEKRGLRAFGEEPRIIVVEDDE